MTVEPSPPTNPVLSPTLASAALIGESPKAPPLPPTSLSSPLRTSAARVPFEPDPPGAVGGRGIEPLSPTSLSSALSRVLLRLDLRFCAEESDEARSSRVGLRVTQSSQCHKRPSINLKET